MTAGIAADTRHAPLRIGMLGASRIAELSILEASERTGDIRAAVAARNPDRARDYAAEHGFETVHESYEALIADESLDLVYISLPNGLHAEWTARALEAGRSVLVEKPFASNLAEFDLVAQRFESAPGWAWEAFHYADHPLMNRMLELLRSGEIGDLREVKVRMLMPSPDAADPRWNFDLAGGTLMDLGCYAIHALLTIADEIGGESAGAGGAGSAGSLKLISASATTYGPDARLDASVDAKFTLGTDVRVAMQASMESDVWDFGIELIGTKGSLYAPNYVIPNEDNRILVRTWADDVEEAGDVAEVEPTEREERPGTVSSYTYQLARVRRELRDGVRDAEHLARSRATMAMIDEVYTAANLPLRPAHLVK